MRNIKKTKLFKTMFATGVVLAGVSTGTYFVIKTALENSNKDFDGLGHFYWTNTTTSEDVLDAIEKSSNISSFKNQSVNFLKSKVYTYERKVAHLSVEEANEVATKYGNQYSAELQASIDQYRNAEYLENKKNSNVSPLTETYNQLTILNNKYEIDPVDYYQFETVSIPQLKAQCVNVVDKKEAMTALNKIQHYAKEEFLGNNLDWYQFSLVLAEAFKSSEKSVTDLHNQFVLDEVKKMISNRRITLDTTAEKNFPDLLAAYSSDGLTGYSLKNNVLSQEDVYNFVLAKRDTMFNTDFLEVPANVDDELVSTEELTPGFSTVYGQLDEISAKDENMSSYKKGEILPGYTLKLRLVDLDYTSDSKYAKVSLQAGIIETKDSDQNDVLWIETEGQPEKRYFLKGLFQITTFEQKFNCAKNNFYQFDLELEYSRRMFEWRKIPQRQTIDEVLKNAPEDASGRYTMSEQNPYLVDPSIFNLDGVVKPHQLEDNHTNEKLMIKIVDVNTNFGSESVRKYISEGVSKYHIDTNPDGFLNLIPSVLCSWVIADLDPQNPSEYKTIKEYQWTNENREHTSYLRVYFPYAAETLALLQSGKKIAALINDFAVLGGKESNGKTTIQNLYDSLKLVADCTSLLGFIIGAASGVNDLIAIAVAVTTAFTGLGLAFAAAMTLTDVINVTDEVLIYCEESDFLEDLYQLVKVVDEFNKYIPEKDAKIYKEYYQILSDPRMSITRKINVAWMATHYMFIYVPSFLEFINVYYEKFDKDSFTPVLKWWLNYAKDSQSKVSKLFNFGLRYWSYPYDKIVKTTDPELNPEFWDRMVKDTGNEDLHVTYDKLVENIDTINALDIFTTDSVLLLMENFKEITILNQDFFIYHMAVKMGVGVVGTYFLFAKNSSEGSSWFKSRNKKHADFADVGANGADVDGNLTISSTSNLGGEASSNTTVSKMATRLDNATFISEGGNVEKIVATRSIISITGIGVIILMAIVGVASIIQYIVSLQRPDLPEDKKAELSEYASLVI